MIKILSMDRQIGNKLISELNILWVILSATLEHRCQIYLTKNNVWYKLFRRKLYATYILVKKDIVDHLEARYKLTGYVAFSSTNLTENYFSQLQFLYIIPRNLQFLATEQLRIKCL